MKEKRLNKNFIAVSPAKDSKLSSFVGDDPYNNFFLSFISQFIFIFFKIDLWFVLLFKSFKWFLQVNQGATDMEFSFIASRLQTRAQGGVILIP